MEPDSRSSSSRVDGWMMPDYRAWSDRLLAEGTAFVLPTLVNNQPALRFCFVNPRTTIDDVNLILDTKSPPNAPMRDHRPSISRAVALALVYDWQARHVRIAGAW